MHTELEPRSYEHPVLLNRPVDIAQSQQFEIVPVLLGLGRVWRKRNLRRGTTHIKKSVGVVSLPVIVLVWRVKSTHEIVCRNPSVKSLGHTRDHLDVNTTVREQEIRVVASIRADIVQ